MAPSKITITMRSEKPGELKYDETITPYEAGQIISFIASQKPKSKPLPAGFLPKS